MKVVHREYGDCIVTGHDMIGETMRYSLAVYRDAHGNNRADGMVDGPASVLMNAVLADKFVSIALKDGGVITALISNVQSNGGTAHAKFTVSGPVPGIAA